MKKKTPCSKSRCSTDPSLESDLLQVLQKVTHFLAPYLEIHPIHLISFIAAWGSDVLFTNQNTQNRKQGSTIIKCKVSLVQVWGKKCYGLVSYICVIYIYISLYHTTSTMLGPVFWSLVDPPGAADFSSPRW